MEDTELLNNYLDIKKTIDAVVSQMKALRQCENNRGANLKQIKTRLDQLKKLFPQCVIDNQLQNKTMEWLNQYYEVIDSWQKKAQESFANELDVELKKTGKSLQGNLPRLKTGFFSFYVNFSKWSVRIFYGAEEEALGSFVPDPVTLADGLQLIQSNLGSNIPEDHFISLLHSIYEYLAKEEAKEKIPIIQIYKKMAEYFENQVTGPQSKKKSKKYHRADFSYDLFRTRTSKCRPEMVVAVMAYTQHREDYLWVPQDETGKGSNYSFLQF